MEIKKLSPTDIDAFTQLILVFEDVFDMQNFRLPKPEHLMHVLAKPDFIVLVAQEDNRVIGGLTAYTLPQYNSEKPLAYLYDLAIQTKYQRQGHGKKLITALNTYCAENNYEEVYVQADKADAYALDFYRSTQPTDEDQVVHFYYTLPK